MSIAARLYREDDRSAERHRLERDATLRDSDWAPLDAVVEDLSAGGFRVVVSAELRVGSEIGLGLAGIGVRKARVVRQAETGYGCEFLEPLSDSDFAKALVAAPAAPIRLPYGATSQAELEEALYAAEPVVDRLPLRTRVAIIVACAAGGWALLGGVAWGVAVLLGLV
ncbi:PilZ domain-containing protein [Sphingomonas sp.]|uniref:PilZ domain-containing protein n=1 Tax=Sphingomonas sp. TaxID=28214 RepID=UPI001B11043C|nr:PilZ domain-containing protein [Sphingomonas sp.]MBO9713159.1 PilZ domain-containing protein [Sphingomonas sp.]